MYPVMTHLINWCSHYSQYALIDQTNSQVTHTHSHGHTCTHTNTHYSGSITKTEHRHRETSMTDSLKDTQYYWFCTKLYKSHNLYGWQNYLYSYGFGYMQIWVWFKPDKLNKIISCCKSFHSFICLYSMVKLNNGRLLNSSNTDHIYQTQYAYSCN